jgi:omega-amidase
MDDLHVTLIQSDIFPEDSQKNIDHFRSVINTVHLPSGLLLLPEMFNTGFSMNPEKCAEKMEGPAVSFLREASASSQSIVAASVFIGENGAFYNRMICMKPDGTCDKYDKRHLFRLSDEFRVMNGGKERTVVTWRGWKILLMICYDLRFPVWSRNRWKDGEYEYDILLYAANWPESRSPIWRSLLIARAIENQCYVLGVNRIGKDGSGTSHSGESMIISPDGKILAEGEKNRAGLVSALLSYQWLKEFRARYLFAPDWDSFTIQT